MQLSKEYQYLLRQISFLQKLKDEPIYFCVWFGGLQPISSAKWNFILNMQVYMYMGTKKMTGKKDKQAWCLSKGLQPTKDVLINLRSNPCKDSAFLPYKSCDLLIFIPNSMTQTWITFKDTWISLFFLYKVIQRRDEHQSKLSKI